MFKLREEFIGTVFEYEIEGYHAEDPSTFITDARNDETKSELSSVLDNYLGKKIKVTIEVVE